MPRIRTRNGSLDDLLPGGNANPPPAADLPVRPASLAALEGAFGSGAHDLGPLAALAELPPPVAVVPRAAMSAADLVALERAFWGEDASFAPGVASATSRA